MSNHFVKLSYEEVCNNADYILELLDTIKYRGVYKLKTYLKSTDFFFAPASTKFHGAYVGGLAEHSLAVYLKANKLNEFFNLKLNEDSIILASICHDLCKVNSYKFMNEGEILDPAICLDEEITHIVRKPDNFPGHGAKSTYIAATLFDLSLDEAKAIGAHMGMYEATPYNTVGNVYHDCPLAWLIHVADEAVTYIDKT